MFLLLEVAKQVNDSKPSPSTPSGMIPPYKKESDKKKMKRRKKQGAKLGHKGLHRSKLDVALPQAMIGNRLLCLKAYWHYALGMAISQIRDALNFHLHLEYPLFNDYFSFQWDLHLIRNI